MTYTMNVSDELDFADGLKCGPIDNLTNVFSKGCNATSLIVTTK